MRETVAGGIRRVECCVQAQHPYRESKRGRWAHFWPGRKAADEWSLTTPFLHPRTAVTRWQPLGCRPGIVGIEAKTCYHGDNPS